MNGTRIAIASGLALGLSVLPEVGLAQGPTPAPAGTTTAAPPLPAPPAPPPVTAAPPAPPPPPAAEPAPARDAAAEKKEDAPVPDHERVVGHLGVTYFDIAALPIANVATGGAPLTSSTVSAPVVGVRYWLKPNIGLDIGIGLGFRGGSQELVANGQDTTTNRPGLAGYAFHGGVPIALYHGHHYSFLVIPNFTVGGTSATVSGQVPAFGTGTADQSLSGFLFDIGAQIGAEIHFGFIGIPELALQATLGLSYRRSVFKWSSGSSSQSDGTDEFGTNVQANPWAIFANNISATYYF